MVQKQTRRRSSLIMGALLALLLGVAAGFFVLAMPIRMLETVTTFSGLSKLMVQAEPPISPNDRTLLAVLAGILTAGIGWVLVDWLLFGRAGMRTLIREREDEYEDEDGDSFRPTDPLDLVSPVSLPTGDWAPAPTGDARRPLSARTDIGDPPKSSLPTGMPPTQMPGIDQLLPPIDQILPGVGGSPPQLRSTNAPDPFQPAAPPLSGGVWGTPEQPDSRLPAPWPPVETPAPVQSADPAAQPAGSAASWLPTPGVRPDGSQPRFEVPAPPPLEADPLEAEAPQSPASQPLAFQPAAPQPTTFFEPPPLIAPAPLSQPVPPLEALSPEWRVPGKAPSPFVPQATPPENVFAPPPQIPAAPPPMAFDPFPAAAPEPPQPAPAPPRAPAEPGFDRERLEDLLVRLERGLQNRRATAARAAAAAAALVPTPQPAIAPAPIAAPEPPRVAPPAAYAAPQPAPFAIPQPVAPPASFAAPQPVAQPPVAQPPVMPTTAPVYDLPPMPAAPAYNPTPLPQTPHPSAAPSASGVPEARNDELLDQPLHLTLDLLRSRVKR